MALGAPTHSQQHAPLGDYRAGMRMPILAGMALIVGTGGALAAWLLIHLIAFVANLAWHGRLSFAVGEGMIAGAGVMTLFIPVIGSLIIGLMARFGSEKIRGHGIPEAIEAILYGESRLSPKVAALKPLSSAISIGTGGPFGAEGPIIMTGGAIGSLLAQRFHLTAAERKTLLVAGAAAGMTAIFGTPLAAVLLAVEILLFEWKPRSFVPVVAGVAAALAWRPLLIGSGPMFPFHGALPGGAWVLAAALAMGLVAGAASVTLSATLYRVEDLFHRLPIHWMWWPALGAVVVGIGGLIEPRVLGAGYGNIQDLLDGSLLVQAALLLLVVKGVVWLVALGSGTSGGVLAPLLILGGALGAIVGQALPGDPGIWVLFGMIGVMGASMRAPLTATIFGAELTGHFASLPAGLLVAVSAYAVAVLVQRRSILTEKISRRGRHILQEFDVDPLELVPAGRIMTPDPRTFPASATVGEAIAFFETEARHRSYPLVDKDGKPIGLISRADALRWRESADDTTTLEELASDASTPTVTTETPAARIAELMIESGEGRVCVVDAGGRLTGIIARRDLLQARAEKVRAEKVRARFVGKMGAKKDG